MSTTRLTMIFSTLVIGAFLAAFTFAYRCFPTHILFAFPPLTSAIAMAFFSLPLAAIHAEVTKKFVARRGRNWSCYLRTLSLSTLIVLPMVGGFVGLWIWQLHAIVDNATFIGSSEIYSAENVRTAEWNIVVLYGLTLLPPAWVTATLLFNNDGKKGSMEKGVRNGKRGQEWKKGSGLICINES